MKKLLEKLGINLDNKSICISCKKEIKPEDKICPHCDAWNDCCSLDPRKLK